MSGVHSFGLPAKPLKDKQLPAAFGGAQDRVAVGPMSPTIELASSNFPWPASDRTSRLEPLDSAHA